jgi:peptide chain release factor 3
MDREANDPYELLSDIENVLGIATCPVNWPIGSGKEFAGTYDRNTKEISLFTAAYNGQREVETETLHIDDANTESRLGTHAFNRLKDDIELLDGASAEFDLDEVTAGKLSPVFFGSALTNFGVKTFLEHFLEMTYSPLPRNSDKGIIDPFKEDFSAFVFKIQANMNKAHRDRIAFMRICSGKFTAGMEVNHVQGKKKVKLAQPQQMMAQERHIIEEAYAGDIIGVFDPGIFAIGDTLCTSNEKFAFEGIPTFAPEHFARCRQIDTMKRKQFMKGVTQIAQEGAIQIFQDTNTGMEEIIVGVVGVLQFDVLKFRLKNEYNVEIGLEPLPYEHIRWIANPDEFPLSKITGPSDMRKITDLKGNPLVLFVNSWSVGMCLDRNKGLELTEFSKN